MGPIQRGLGPLGFGNLLFALRSASLEMAGLSDGRSGDEFPRDVHDGPDSAPVDYPHDVDSPRLVSQKWNDIWPLCAHL